MSKWWIGVDLDGTLAEHEPGEFVPGHIGAPIQKMVDRVKIGLAQGKNIKIFTARAVHEDAPKEIAAIEPWCLKHFGQVLPITATKDRFCIEIWDDRAVAVGRNTGEYMTPNKTRLV